MKKTLTRLFTVALLLMVSLGAWAEVKVLFGVNGTELQPDKDGKVTLGQKELTGGTVIISQEDQKDGTTKLFLAVTPDKGYTMAKDGIKLYATIPANAGSTRAPEVSAELTPQCEDFKGDTQKRTYYVNIDSKLALWVKKAEFKSASKDGSTRATNYKYVIINNKGNKAFNYTIRGDITYSSINKEQLCVHPKAKSVLAENFRFYTTEAKAVADANGTIGTSGTDYYTEGTTISGIAADVTDNTFYVRYSLKDNPAIDISGEKLYKMQARNRAGTLFYIAYQANDKSIRIKSTDDNNNSFLWKLESGDPYDMYIYNIQGTTDHSNGVFTVRNIVSASGESALNSNIYYDDEITSGYDQSKSPMNLQSFILTQGSNDGYQYNNNWINIWGSSYQIIGAYNAIENKPRDEGTNTYALPGNMPYYVCVNGSGDSAPGKNGDQLQFYRNWRVEDPSNKNTSQIKFIEVKQAYTFHIINNSGAEAVCASTASELNAGATITASMIPDIIKSPLASNYTFYSTAADAAAGSNALTRLPYPSHDVYVRYTTNGGDLDVNGGTDYYVSTGGKYLYGSSASAIGIESSITSTDNTRKWIITGNDAYQLILQNAGNSNYVTYNVSSGEAVPTLSASGSKFFLHQGTNGKYELVAVTTNDFSTTDYYTLGVANNTLKLYSKTNYPLGNDAVQTFFSDHDFCAKPVISFDNSNNQITIDCATAGASIYYTDDGTPPTSSSTLYTGAFTVSDGTTIKAIATKAESDDSEVASLTIVLTPTITLEGTPCTYDGTEKEPTVSSVKVGETIIDPSEYTVSYNNNINVGSTATVTITDNEGGDYYVAGDITFTIDPLSIGSGTLATGFNIDVSMSGGNYVVTVKHGETTLIEGTDYTWTGGPEVTVTGMGNYTGSAQASYFAITPGYYVIHQNGTGYLKVSGAGVNLGNDGTFQSGNLFDKGNCIWYITPEGYLQNEYFYLNVANNNTLYLSVDPVTRWRSENVTGENTYGKKHLKINDGTKDLFLCYDNKSIKLKDSPTAFYNACPVEVEEVSWTDTPVADDLTLQSPQLVTYLRAYFTQKIKYSFHNDAGAEVASTDGTHERRVYATLAYASGGDGKGTNWDIDESGILYNKKTSGDVDYFTATYNLLPADPKAREDHPTAVAKDIKYKVTQKPLALIANMDYLLYSISAGDNYRYPYDDGVADGDPVKPDGKGGTDNTSVLTDPGTNGITRNLQISWKITADAEGFYTFQNSSTNKYLYFDEAPHASSDYGVLRLGDAPTGNSAKFRLYKTSDSNYGDCYYIIPYSKLFAVYKSNGLADGLFIAVNTKDYTGKTPKVISLFKPNSNSTWCIYKYEAENRFREDFTLTGPSTADAAGDYEFSSVGWYGKFIKQSPKTGDANAQKGLVISGTYQDESSINYQWTVTGLGTYINITDGTNTDGTWTKTTTGDTNNRKLVINVPNLPTSVASGVVKLKQSSGTKTSAEKTLAFSILGDGTVTFTDIKTLAEITSSSGAYRLIDDEGSDFVYSASNKPGVAIFSGVLDGNNLTISGLSTPLFDNLSNGTVRNVNLSGVSISSHSGPTGAIAGTADGGSRIYNVGILDGSVGSSDDVCGGLVGILDGFARVINCFSYAEITSGTKVGGIVGENKYKTNANDTRTMVMNCMFYGNITGGTNKAPIYNGEIISNVGNTGVGNYNYFLADATFTGDGINTYNCALMAEKRFLQRFEFYRQLLNSHLELAGWWATGTFSKTEMAKWVLEPSQIGSTTPYPILKTHGKYASVVNYTPNETAYDENHRNEGRQLTSEGDDGVLHVTISMGSGGAQYTAPSGAGFKSGEDGKFDLIITDKDYEHFNFNYGKVQLPYYNDYCVGNYTGNRVVTGWKITSITGGTTGSFVNSGDNISDATVDANGNITSAPFNFADRNCTDKDLYSVSERVFNQGAYWDVPEGVTAITIEPYWGKCVYLADANADVVYSEDMKTAYPVSNVGGGKIYNNGSSYSIAGDNQLVYTTMSNAISSTNSTGLFVGIEGDPNNHTVYDYAVVLVGNYHNYNSIESSNSKPYTVTSIDLDGDNEPDYSYILRFDARKGVHPVKVDFLNVPGLGMAQKSTGSTGTYNFGIMQPMSWFEVTNTALFRVTQFEYEHKDRAAKPLILQGGVIEQWVSGQSGGNGQRTTYIHVGSNVWFKEFHLGCHQDATLVTKHPPVSVTGGDYNEFYLTGLYSGAGNCDDNAECYINGGRFDKVAGTGIEGIGDASTHANGNIVWQIQNADIEEFYGGGINATKPIEGSITTVITGSHVKRFCGGPKFGDMNPNKTVITTATNCTFGSFFGAGYGGNSYNRVAPGNFTNKTNYSWNDWIAGTTKGNVAPTGSSAGDYPGGIAYNGYKQDYISAFGGVSTRFDYQFLPQSDNTNNVGRLFIDFVNFSLATTRNVTSTLTGCTITGNFYGGGSLGKVEGDVTSTLKDCTVRGSVFGGGYDATRPTVQVMNTKDTGSIDGFLTPPRYDTNTGTFFPAAEPYNTSTEYTWEYRETVGSETAIDKTNHILYTTKDLTTLGQVTGDVTLNILGNTQVEGQAVDYEGNLTGGDRGGVFGGGDASAVLGNTEVNFNATGLKTGTGYAYNTYNVFGGGNKADVGGSVTVNMTAGTVEKDVYGGGALANTNIKNVTAGYGTSSETISSTSDNTTTVNLLGGTINGDAYGGGLGRQANDNVSPAVTAVEAKVYGDVKIYLNGMDKSFYDAAVANDAPLKDVFNTRITQTAGATYYPVKNNIKGAVVERVFGANNKNGSPQGNVTVHVFGTQHKDAENIRTKLKNANADLEQGSSQNDEQYIAVLKSVLADMITKAKILNITVTNDAGTGYQDIYDISSTADDLKKAINDINDEINDKIWDENTSADDIDALFARIYDVEAVYGGGNEAAYIPKTAYHPTNATTGSKTQVIIEGCDETSIEAVYGGGNAASVPETNVDIVSAHEIQTVFGGGNGKDNKSDGSPNPGADVGVYKVGTTETIYGTGNATTLLEGGYFHEAYGASNSKGNIKGNISINTNPDGSSCSLKYDKLVGAGKNADVDKDVIMILGCNPRTKNPLIFGGADNANVNGNVELTITSGTFGKVFGGNNLGGIIKGHIKVNIEETECTPIRIDELYLGGNQAAYSRYGYYKDGDVYKPRTAAMAAITDPNATGYQAAEVGNHIAPYDEPVLNVISCTYIGKVFGGGYGERAVLYGNPTVNINMIAGRWASELGAADKLGEIVDVFGGGNAAKVEGNTTVNIGTEAKVKLTSIVDNSSTTDVDESQPTVKGANITGNVYGGGNLADVTGNTNVNICAKYNTTSEKWDGVTPGTAGVSIAGNVYGGGKGEARESGDRAFYCEEAMVGLNDTNSATNNDAPAYADYGTHVRIGNGTIGNGTTGGNVYGGGEIGRVEFHTEVVIGLGEGTGGTAKSPVINGCVFGAGKGTNTHGYSGLVRGDSRVTIQGDAKVGHSVYGGGEMASIGKYELDANGLPKTPKFGGKCTVTIQGYAEIGPDNMQMTKAGGPDDTGHVFGAGKGTLPYENVTGTPWSMELTGKVNYDEGKESDYYKFIQSLGLASNTDVTIGGHAFVKGSVYGGSENGYLQANTHVTIAGGQVGAGYDKEQNKSLPKYAETAFIDPSITPVTTDNALATCATWTYDKTTTGNPYDKYAGTAGYDAKGGAVIATDGHTYYGNVFGGGRGVVPFAAGKWHRAAGSVAGNTQVDITAGHILSSVYGGNENTDVGSYALGTDGEPTTTLSSGGTCTINITGGTVGVPRTKEQIEDNPVIGNVFGAGKGDKRVLFNTWTNVGATSVNISGTAKIYGSVFGGGEDGHVINNAVTNIGGTVTTGVVGNTTEHTYSKVVIGSTGISGADGNVFGGGRGSVTALTAGVVGGNANLTINKGIIMGNVYGGGRLASVGTNFTNPTLENGDPDPRYGELQTPDADHGNITVTVNDGTIGSSTSTGVNGNIFGGSKGTETNWKLGIARSTTINMTGGTAYASVYGGGELAQVVGSHTTNGQVLGTEVNISGGTIGIQGKGRATWGNVYAGGKGNTTHVEAGLVKTNTKANISQAEGKTTTIYHNIYGGGAYGSVGTFDLSTADNLSTYQVPYAGMPVNWATGTGTANVTITGGTIGTDGKENGMVFGSSRGDIAALGEIHDKLAWVNNVNITVGTDGSETGPQIKGSVYGSGENGHTYNNTEVTVYSGTIGIANSSDPGYSVTSDGTTYSGAEYPYRGNVYGGGCGTDKYYSGSVPEGHTANDGEGNTYNSLAGIVYGTTTVTIDGGHVVRNVYGAGAMGSVGKFEKNASNNAITFASGGKTTIAISGGTIGVDGTNGDGNVFGAARGDASSAQTDVALVKTTDVTISGDATIVWGNVYGGGQIGCVGTFDETDGKYVWSSGGLSKVTVSGGKIGPDNNDNPEIGNVFGAGKGKANTFKCEKAMVRETIVSISDGTVNGNVYGGGEIGRVEENTEVTIGRKSGEAEGAGTGKPIINGSVFGAGKGKETHGYSALVRGNTTVTVEGATGAKVGNSVYGGGEIASVGRYGLDNKKMPEILVDGGYCYVKVLGNVVIGPSNASDDKGNVFGAGKGVNPAYVYKTSDRENNSKRMVTYDPTGRHQTGQGTLWDPYDDPDDPNDDPTHPNFVWEYFMGNATTGVSGEDEFKNYLETLALATHPEVTIGGNATVNSSVFGGGELGLTKGSVVVSIRGGTVVKDVYGGGSLANTNTTSTWAKRDAEGKPLPPDEHGNYAVDEVKIHPTTTVNLLGGSLRDAYGGGLGRLASTGVSAVEAFVYGDVKVELNNNNNGSTAVGTSKGCIVNRIFGCNNLNGSPKAKVQVYVYATQNRGQSTISGKTKGTYDVQAVYGGGNLSAYEPDDALLEYTDANKATVDAARTEVYIDGCDLTSIKQVYGGGNAASVPATYVLVNRAFEIDEVFGGGNGADDYSLTNGTNTVWYKNPGANVGYYDYTRLVTDQDKGEDGKFIGTGSGTEADPYKNIDKENARTKVNRQNPDNHYMYGSGIATTEIKGGTIHTVYGGSNSRGNVRTKLSSSYSGMFDDCPMVINTTYGSGKNAESDGEVEVLSDCAKGISVMFGGAENADVDNDINLIITNGSSLQRVFGGNNTSGAINGSITVTIKEGGCEPIRIGELYAGGFLAPYSIYGYKKTNGVYDTEEVEYFDENDNTVKKKLQRIPLESASEDVTPKANPRINVISATRIDNIFGGGYQAKLVGSPHINVNMEPGRILAKYVKEDFVGEHKDTDGNVLWTGDHIVTEDGPEKGDGILAIGTIGNVYGGGNMADIVGDTYVEIGTGTEHNDAGELVAITPARNGAKITGNVFGGGKGKADTFLCEKAMIGKDGDGVNNPDGGTHVTIGNGTVDGNVYGGGEIGRVEKNTVVTIGIGDGVAPDGTPTSAPEIKGSVFGGGKGKETHGYAALVRGNPTVVIQGNAKVGHSVYGGGEIASVARYKVAKTNEEAAANGVEVDMPYVLANNTSGKCIVKVLGYAEIGPDDMKMYHDNIAVDQDKPDDWGHVFGAGKGIMPEGAYDYVNGVTKRMVSVKDAQGNIIGSDWEYFADEATYITFIQTLALASKTDVTIGDHAFVKGSVYGGSENGLVQFDTDVKIQDECQIGNGDGVNRRYTTDEWAYDGSTVARSLKECAHWDYGREEGTGENKKTIYAPYDPNANATGNLDKYSNGKSTEGGRRIATDGHTYYGNVFGGGSGSVPYFDAEEGISKYLNSAGTVKGNTKVTISGGHILTNVYGGCEATNVLGKATVKMTNGTIGVPRTAQQIKDHPVTCYLFGAGKGDQRIYFNKETNVNDAIVNVEGGRIYGSVFGGGEDGHVLRNTTVTIGKTDGTGPKIGTVGSTYVDGNVFGGGRGFGGEALTAGNVGGTVDLTINGGEMLGSIYGGGRLASVGYGLYLTTEKGFGANNDDGYGKMQDDGYSDWTKGEDGQYTRTEISGFKRGYITVTVNGGTIGSDVEDEHSGNVFGGSMGRLAKIDGSPFDDPNHWALLATAKTTEVNVTGGIIKRNVYGGGEMGTVIEKATVNISGGTIGKSGGDNVEIGNVFGGGKGYLDPAQTYVGAGIVKGNTNVTIKNGASGGTTTTPTIYQNVYGGGELGYVGMFTTPDHKEYTWTENTGLCTVGVAGGTITGNVFGAGKGKDDTFECERAMVRTTSVAVSGGKVGGNVYGGGEVGRVDQNSAVTIGSATGDSAPTITGSVFGAGAGVETHGYSALVRGNTAVIVQGNAKVGNSVYGGGQIAAVGRYGLDSSGMPSTLVSGGECVVTVQGNAVIGANGIGNVFGAGMGVDESKKTYTYADNANRPKRMMTYASGLYTDDNQALWEFSDATHTYVWEYFDKKTKYLNFLQTLALATDTRLTINGNASVKGSVYGGSESGFVQRDTEVKILGGEILTVKDAAGNTTEGNVFGGGKGISDNDAAGRVRSDTRITVLDGTINGDVYGGGALGKANTLSATNTTIVNLLGGTVKGDVFGGGLGNATTAADVGNTKVNLNGLHAETDVDATTLSSLTGEDKPLEIIDSKYYRVKSTRKGAVVKGNVFGANNVNGTPKGHVLVHVHGTQNETTSALNAKVDGLYDVTGVFGGGNASDYVPDAADTKQSTEVIIEGCDLTSIEEVYGGGYGAAVPATDVLIKGTKIINNVFGGGYGAGTDNPGANVGYVTGGSRSPYALGTGKAVVQLMAGTVNNVYGGSNTKGDIRSGSNVTNVANDNSPGCCDKLSVKEIYGGGSQADMFGGTEIVLGCMPDDWIGAIYAGAENANVGNDVSLTLTSGKFGRVFGGNKSGGTIDGYIEVNIEENPECSTPIIIGGLYGGGNEAPYTVPARYFTNNPNYQSPRVNVRAFTSIGNIYGGGFGASATVTGNPLVNINEVQGGREYAGEDKPLEDGTTVKLYARKADGKMGVIGNVFGGGNAAKVIGNTNVMIGTEAEQEMESLKTTDATTGTVTVVKKPVLGADIQGNVYGAGNNAEVTGHTNVVIGKKAE